MQCVPTKNIKAEAQTENTAMIFLDIEMLSERKRLGMWCDVCVVHGANMSIYHAFHFISSKEKKNSLLTCFFSEHLVFQPVHETETTISLIFPNYVRKLSLEGMSFSQQSFACFYWLW